ncbi:hypothetical protein L210DRAFT_3512239 [Boletus edulis BED1]|uniref:Uncharacterized protein n=1 Tax=Boletus edulis BED1 TaxID=1328754 RepID=A0AAD4BBH4_BOLED|nr:hypothetical protein L210DRAFT_3512239 [Boletus edulis BED1]
MPSYVCESCASDFDEKNLYINHYKKCVTTVAVTTYSGEKMTLHRNENKVFLCYCSHPACPKSAGFTRSEGLLKHMKRLKTTWIGAEKKTPSNQPTSVTITKASKQCIRIIIIRVISMTGVYGSDLRTGHQNQRKQWYRVMKSPSLHGDDVSMASSNIGSPRISSEANLDDIDMQSTYSSVPASPRMYPMPSLMTTKDP